MNQWTMTTNLTNAALPTGLGVQIEAELSPALLILSLSSSACLPTAGALLEAMEEVMEEVMEPGLLARLPSSAPLPRGLRLEAVDCAEVSSTEVSSTEGVHSEGAWLTSVVAGDSPGFLFFLMAASRAAPLPPDTKILDVTSLIRITEPTC